MGCPVLGLRPRPGRGERGKNFACGGRKLAETLSPFFYTKNAERAGRRIAHHSSPLPPLPGAGYSLPSRPSQPISPRSPAGESSDGVTFVSHVQTDRTIELYCAGEHVHDLRSGEVYQTSASANQRWTARCGGSTVQVWDVRTGRATAFEVPADTPLPVNRGRGRRAAAR